MINWAQTQTHKKRRGLVCEIVFTIIPTMVLGFHFLSSWSSSLVAEESPMAKKVADEFTWVIKNFSSLESKKIYSDEFVIGGCKWRIKAFPKGNNTSTHFSLYLAVADAEYLPLGWRRRAKLSYTIANQNSEEFSLMKETIHWFNEKEWDWGYTLMISLAELKAKDGGFMVNGNVKIVMKVEVLEVIGKLDVAEESEEVTQPLKRERMNDGGAVSQNLPKETPADWVDVNGFRVLPYQAESMRRVFKRHPDIAAEFQGNNQQLKTACMFALLGLMETLCKSLEELSDNDLVEASNVLIHLKHSGFKVEWLEKKLEEVKEKKTCEIVIQNYEEELKDIKQKCADKEAIVEKEKEELNELKLKYSRVQEALREKKKAKALASFSNPLTFDDVL